MCGISGVFDPGSDSEALVCRMISMLVHRGPDASGIYVDGDVALGHCRLSIVGIDSGNQPISNEDDSIWIVYNGEIFNFPELRIDLIKNGHVFKTSTDTEVLIHLYEEYGVDCLKTINGQFAFAIWDTKKKELFLARDRVGIRPLFYWQAGKKYCFASEIKAIFVDPTIPREIDAQSLYQFFTYWTALTPRTAFKGVFEIPPGHYQIVRDGAIYEQKPFWRIPYYEQENRWKGTFDDAADQIKALLLDAVRMRLRADVPVGAYLSGGLDSSIITSLICRHFNNQLKTFSIGFDTDEYDESSFQQVLVNDLVTDHHQFFVTPSDICKHFPDAIWFSEKPLLRTAPVPLFLLSKLVRDCNYKVVLTGEGADEVFGGYHIFKEMKIRLFWSRFPNSPHRPRLVEKLYPYIFKNPARSKNLMQKFFSVASGDKNDPFISHRIRWKTTGKNIMFFSGQLQQKISISDSHDEELIQRLPNGFESWDPLSRAQFLEMDIFLSNYLLSSQGDRAAMANSVETRMPFLDFRIIDFAASLPPSWKISGLNEKYILKYAFRNTIPPQILTRSKKPYRAPIQRVFLSNQGSYVQEMFSEDYLKKTGYFDIKKVRLLLDKYQNEKHTASNETQSMALVGILSTQLLHKYFIEGHPYVKNPLLLTKKIRRIQSAH